jgi:hypothetical protein
MLAVLAVAFSLFFMASKHDPAFAQVNPFAEDPFDAVASFGVQFVLFIAALSVLRTFRLYPAKTDLGPQAVLIARGQFMGLLAVAVTTTVDGIAMFRHQGMWQHTIAGNQLLGLVAGFFLWAAIGAVGLARTFSPGSRKGGLWRMQAGIAFMIVSIAWWYPENLRQGLAGALFTVFVGYVILFIPIKELAETIGPVSRNPQFDLIDDVASLFGAMKAHVSPLADLCAKIEPALGRIADSKVLSWLDPRVHRWNLVVAVGATIGISLALLELTDGGASLPFGRVLLVLAVYASVQTLAVAAGYGLLADPLALVRRTD